VAAFPDFPPYVTWNNSLGQPDKLTGFGYDFLLEACDVCDLDCEIVIDKWSNCWTATDLPGTGLQAGYYHGCATYTNQYQRQWSLEFSDGILQKNKPAGILSRLVNGVPTIPPTSDLSGFKICDVAGWAPTIKTLYYSENDCTDHSLFKDFIIVTPPDEGPDPAMTMLLNGECDGVYMYSDLIEKRQVCNGCAWDPALYSQLGTEYAWVHTGVVEHMANGTTLTMSKKGSGVPALVNPCIQKAGCDTRISIHTSIHTPHPEGSGCDTPISRSRMPRPAMPFARFAVAACPAAARVSGDPVGGVRRHVREARHTVRMLQE